MLSLLLYTPGQTKYEKVIVSTSMWVVKNYLELVGDPLVYQCVDKEHKIDIDGLYSKLNIHALDVELDADFIQEACPPNYLTLTLHQKAAPLLDPARPDLKSRYVLNQNRSQPLVLSCWEYYFKDEPIPAFIKELIRPNLDLVDALHQNGLTFSVYDWLKERNPAEIINKPATPVQLTAPSTFI